ncbi:hypothetical protein [Curtobacterium sp. ER1/6]|uniref:hypothetical protein n=1 Tax=Curtobacterium sp. ER1/6 TaxID=1891920 RepID=UPI00084F9A90|nr:hypothetical protein [Curtobacterium sp. ER1/6]
MRVFVSLVVIVVATALALGAGLLVAFQLGGAADGLVLASVFTIPFLVMGPVLVGSLAGYWDPRSSPEGRRYLRWWFLGVLGIDLVAAVVVVLATVSARAPVWVPVVLIVGAAVLLVVARPLGDRFRRSERVVERSDDDVVPSAAVVRRGVRTIAVTFVVSAVVATIGATLLVVSDDGTGDGVLRSVLLAGQLTFTATAIATVLVALPCNRALRDVGGRDIGRLQRFGKVVLRGRSIPLDAAEERGALQYARLVPLTMRFQLAFTGLLYVGLAFQFVSSTLDGQLGVLPVVFLVAMVAVLLWAVPTSVRRMRRARDYAERHGGAPSPTADEVDPRGPSSVTA